MNTNGIMAIQFKTMLNDIIDNTFPNHEKLNSMKSFKIELNDKNLKSKLGDYFHSTAQIRIFHLQNEEWSDIIVTLIHEATHHIDYVIRNISNHDSEFYAIHKKLLYTAFDMSILSKELVENSKTNAANKNKLSAMLSDYEYHPIEYKNNQKTFHIYNCFEAKEHLKNSGYRWNGIDKAWIKTINAEDSHIETEALHNLGINSDNIIVTSGAAIQSKLHKTIFVYNTKFDMKEILKELKYQWDPTNKCWKKNILNAEIIDFETEQLQKLNGIKVVVK